MQEKIKKGRLFLLFYSQLKYLYSQGKYYDKEK